MKKTLIALALVSLSSPLLAQDVAKGETLYKKCIMCHGKNGEGNKAQQAPRLAGQYDWYVVTQLKNFKSKTRSNPKMFPFIANLSEKDFKDLAAYVAQMK